jgi:prepilin-type N-terminal cleavage/methylation domain-containing protein
MKRGFTLPPVKSKICALLRFTSQQRRFGTVSFRWQGLSPSQPQLTHLMVGLFFSTRHKPRNEKTFAFTLAEVLITLAIIGVVAALSIPSVVKNYQETQFKTAYKKAFSDLNRVFAQPIAFNEFPERKMIAMMLISQILYMTQ